MAKLGDLLFGRPYVSIRDVLRHEYAHAIEHHHSSLIHSKRFREAFGARHDDNRAMEFDPYHFVSDYAASMVGQEDYAETFMFFIKYRGKLPVRFDTPPLNRKWQFISDLGRAISRNRRRW